MGRERVILNSLFMINNSITLFFIKKTFMIKNLADLAHASSPEFKRGRRPDV
jgi:hypothetical protein